MSLRVLIVDDESLARQRIRTLVSRREDLSIIGECATGAEAVEAILRQQPDLVFLDVQMPEMDGFDVIAKVGADVIPPVIFITAFDEYAINAFEVGAIDYLLKPVDEERFNQTVERATSRVAEKSQPALAAQLGALITQMGGGGTPGSGGRIGIKVQGKVVFLNPSEIYWIQARDDVARVHLADSAYDVREPLRSLEERLPHSTFLRIHRSAIVNTAHVVVAEPFDQGDQMLILRNGKRLTTGRSYRKSVQEFLRRAT
jgi:two-component system, LytTR family, response regulator